MSLEQEYILLFNVTILNVSMEDAIKRISQAVLARACANMHFVNADCLNKVTQDPDYLQVLQQSDVVFGDGIGVRIASIMAGTPIVENLNGTDMLPPLCKLCAREGFSLYLLGAKPGVAERMRDQISTSNPGLKIAGLHHGHFNHDQEDERIIKDINDSNADILLVAFGAPLQEQWIQKHTNQLNPSVRMGVGGLFDFYSGDKPRAPLWMRNSGLEWLHRMFIDPRHLWRRYVLGNPLFLWRVLWKRLMGTLARS